MNEINELEAEESRLIEYRDKGNRAKVIVNDDIFRNAMQEIRDRYIATLRDTDPAEIVQLQTAALKLRACEDFLTEFVDVIQGGEMAENNIELVRDDLDKAKG